MERPIRAVRPAGSMLKYGLPALVFAFLAAFSVAPAMLSGSLRVCAADAPDAWMHMWIFWRTRIALAGGDLSYCVSRLLCFPGSVREPMAVFDPLLPLLSVPLQFVFPDLVTVFNVLTFAGLFFTAFSAYLLCTTLCDRPAAGFVGAVIAAFNPFLYRQICGGYIEYAWWGVLPFTVWLLLHARRTGRPALAAAYAAMVVLTFLLSIYLAVLLAATVLLLTFTAVLSAQRGQRRAEIRTLTRIHGWALAGIVVLFAFWGYHLLQFRFQGMPWGTPFPIEKVERQAVSDTLTESSAKPSRIPLDRLSRPAPEAFIAARTLHGSLDVHDLSPAGLFSHRDSESPGSNGVPTFETVRLSEWCLVLVIAAFAAHGIGFRHPRAWTLLALGALSVACGPYLIWNREVFTSWPLPYAFLYRWVPGFSRLVVPGRAFLLTILCLSVLAARGADRCTQAPRPGARTARVVSLAMLLYLWFAISGPAPMFLPATRRDPPAIYRAIRNEPGQFALLELPLRGDLPFRMYCQTVHQRPIFRGAIPDFMTAEQGTEPVHASQFVRCLDNPDRTTPDPAALRADTAQLADTGFRYLLLHRDGYPDPATFEAATRIATATLGPPTSATHDLSVWKPKP